MFRGTPVIAPKDIPKDAIIAVSSRKHFDSIQKDLLELDFHQEQIHLFNFWNTDILNENQYFDMNFMLPQHESLFIDGGCFDCDTITKFINWNTDFGYDGIIAFEPEPSNFTLCTNKSPELGDNIRIINAGLSSKQGKMAFTVEKGAASAFNEDEDGEILPLTTIDDELCGKKVSFIKLDVEGFELAALQGATETIKNHKPRIACCVYHKCEDLIDIPLLLCTLSNEYKFYLRMYTNKYCEIVLYAVC